MEDNNIPIPEFDIARLKSEVKSKAAEYLEVISEQSLEDFANGAKLIPGVIIERYYYDVFDFYTKSVFKIKDAAIMTKFKDLNNGYLFSMKKWVQEHQIITRKMQISPDLELPELKELPIKPKTVVIAGTSIAACITVTAIIKACLTAKAAHSAVATGLIISSSAWAGLAAELLIIAIIIEGLSLGTAYYLSNKEKKFEEDFNYQTEQYQIQLELEKTKLINGLTDEFIKWLDAAKDYSDSLISSFNLQTI